MVAGPTLLTDQQIDWLTICVCDGLHDKRATPENLRKWLPKKLPSGLPMHVFE
jgi:hypothetical protein